MDNQKSLKKNAFFSFLNSFTTLLFPLITFPYASRILLPEGIGKVNFAVSIESYFAMIAGLGISSYATREAAKLRENKNELSKFSKEIIIINFSSMIIAYILLIICILFIPKLNNYKLLILIRSSSIFFTTIGMNWLFQAQEDFKYITIRSLIFKIIGLLFLFLFVTKQEDTLEYIIFGILTSVASNICNLFYSRKYINYKYKCKLEIKKHLHFIFIFFGMTFITSIYTTLDTSMLGFLSDDIQVGYYTAATKLNKLSLGLLTSLTAVLLPRLAYYKQNNEDEKFIQLSEKAICIILLLSIPMVIGLIFLAKPLVLIFSGTNFLPAVSTMNIISPVIFIIGLASITGSQILPAIEKEKIVLLAVTCGALTNVLMNSMFIPRYGAFGAGIGTIAAETVVTSIEVIYLRKHITKEMILTLFQSLFSSCFIIIIIFLLNKFFINPFIIVITSIILGIIIYAFILNLLKNKYFIEYKTYFIRKIFN